MVKNSRHVLIIGFVWPEPQSSAAGKRIMQLITLFRNEGWNVTFASAATKTEQMVDLDAFGVDQVSIKINDHSFNDFVEKLNPSVVLFDRFVTEEQFGWRVAEECPDALRILDTEDLHFLRREREKAVKENRACTAADLRSSDHAKRELASIYRSDLSLIISEAEVHLLEETFGVRSDLLHYLPFLLDPLSNREKQNLPTFDEREHFVTIGNFRHTPNMDANRYLKKDIWPLIRKKIPKAQLHIYGAYPTRQAKQMHDPSTGFLVKGRAEEAMYVISEAKVMLAPLRFGAGLKGKLVEAMQCGTPTVTTEIGTEGMRTETVEWGGRVVDNPLSIANAAQKLYQYKKLWKEAQQRGFKILNSKFGEPDFGRQLVKKIRMLLKNRQEHRLRNFTGQMLLHHTAASTKFMSRWIEAKNQNR